MKARVPFLIVVALLTLAGCGGTAEEAASGARPPEASEPTGAVRSIRIDPDMAAASGVITAVAGAGLIDEVVIVYGRVAADPTAVGQVTARYPGVVRSVRAGIGDRVRAGSVLAEIESDESLNRYTLGAPITGVVTQRTINPGEHTGQRVLFRIVDSNRVWGELALFPADRLRVGVGQRVDLSSAEGLPLGTSQIDWIDLSAAADQSVTARVTLDNVAGRLVAGQHLTGRIHVAAHEAGIAIERAALQTMSGETVVFVQEGDTYGARTVRPGRQDGRWVEILEGLRDGERYVSGNSYLIKADMEKTGAGQES